MVSTYTGSGRFTKQGTNDNPNTWGSILNAQVIELVDEFVSGVVDVDITGTLDVTLSTNNGSSDEARNATLELTGTLGDDIEVHIPALEKQYFIRGSWSGNFTVAVKISGGGTEVLIRTGEKKIIYCNGTDVFDMVDTGVEVSSDDTTAGFLDDKLTVSGPLTKTITDPSANEAINLEISETAHLAGLGLQGGQAFTPGGTSTTDIDFAVGAFAAEDGHYMELATSLTKELDGAWVAGDAAGFLDTGVVAISSTYYIFIIHDPTTGTTDAIASLSRTSPTLPSGYTKKRLVGFILTDVSNLIDDWSVIWTSFGPYTAPTMWLMANLASSNVVDDVYLVFGTDPAVVGARVQFTNVGAINADDDVTAFASD